VFFHNDLSGRVADADDPVEEPESKGRERENIISLVNEHSK
jgi:hypothetical protein